LCRIYLYHRYQGTAAGGQVIGGRLRFDLMVWRYADEAMAAEIVTSRRGNAKSVTKLCFTTLDRSARYSGHAVLID